MLTARRDERPTRSPQWERTESRVHRNAVRSQQQVQTWGFPPRPWVFPRHLLPSRRESVQLFSLVYFGFRGRAECCNILHVCRCQGWNKTSVQANFCPAASKPCPPVVRDVWVRPATQLLTSAAAIIVQCSPSLQLTNTSSPSTPVSRMKPPEP